MSAGRPIRVVVLSPYVPWAGIPHAGGQFLHEYLLRMSQHVEIDLQVLAPDDHDNRERAATAPFPVHIVDATHQTNPVFRAAQFARDRWVTLTPGIQVARAFARDEAVGRAMADADLIEVQLTQYLPLALQLRGSATTPVSNFSHDVWSQSLARRAATSSDRARKLLAKGVRRRVARSERDFLNRCAVVWTFTAKDQSLLRDLGVTTRLEQVDPSLERPEPVPGASGDPVVLFVAALSRPENRDAVQWLLRDIWPRVRAQRPDARLVIAGEGPADLLSQLRGPGVEVTGQVLSLDRYYRRASVAIAPLTTGAGLKFKVPQAMAYGLPVVSTTVGAEGLCEGAWAKEDPFALVSDDAGDFAKGVVSAFDDVARAGLRGADFVRRRFSLAASVTRVVDCYGALAANGGVPAGDPNGPSGHL